MVVNILNYSNRLYRFVFYCTSKYKVTQFLFSLSSILFESRNATINLISSQHRSELDYHRIHEIFLMAVV